MSKDYLFDHCIAFLALCLPGFFLSTFLASLVRNHAALRILLIEGSFSTIALDNQCLIASDCADIPDPATLTSK